MLSLVFLIPIVFALLLLMFFNKKVLWWEYLIVIVPSMLVATCLYFGMIRYSENDTEYLGDYVTQIRYYEPWDEYIHRTCTRTVGSGKSAHTVSYDCSYVDHHDKEWKQVLSNGYEYSISNEEYNRLFKMWNTQNTFVDMHRDYYTYDGDMYQKNYDGIREHSKTRTIENSYINKVNCSNSLFGFTDIKPEDAKKRGLYDYPQLNGGNDEDQCPILGYKTTKDISRRWSFINGYYGPSKQFRCYVLFFYNKPLSVVQEQRSYWKGGNKNEMVMCIGMDSKTHKIQWVDAFSWCDKPTFEVNFRSYMEGQEKVDLLKLSEWTEYGVNNYWKRKDFKDFDYIVVQLTDTQLKWLFIIMILLNIGLSIYVIGNDFEYDENGNEINNNYNRRW